MRLLCKSGGTRAQSEDKQVGKFFQGRNGGGLKWSVPKERLFDTSETARLYSYTGGFIMQTQSIQSELRDEPRYSFTNRRRGQDAQRTASCSYLMMPESLSMPSVICRKPM